MALRLAGGARRALADAEAGAGASARRFADRDPARSLARQRRLGALRQLDDDDNGARVVGSIESYRWRYVVETPGCVRFAELDRAAESYAHHFRDGRDRSKRHPKPPPAGLAPAPDELPRRASAIDPYVDPADLRGRWELRGERWLPVAECAL